MVHRGKHHSHAAFDWCVVAVSSREWLYVHFRDDNTLCARWAFNRRPAHDRRRCRDRRLSDFSRLRSGVSAEGRDTWANKVTAYLGKITKDNGT
jgi:hypothetical protein